jgi:hypothetical protein
MTYSLTTNKSLQEPASGDTNWDVNLNYNFTALDKALGGTQAFSVTGITTTQTLTLLQYQNLILKFSDVLTANLIYQVPSLVGGTWIIVNNTTGAFTLTFRTAAAGASVVIPQGTQSTVFSDGTNVYVADDASFRYNNSSTLFEGWNGTAWLPITGGATGGGNDQIFFQNGQAVTTNYSIPSGKNAMTAGPVSVNAGITVTIPSGSVWTIV